MYTCTHTILLYYCLHCCVIIHCVVNNFVVLMENIFTGDVSMVTGVYCLAMKGDQLCLCSVCTCR